MVMPEKLFVDKFNDFGNEKFYQFLINYATNKIMSTKPTKKSKTPEIEFMEYYDKFMALYRINNQEIYIQMAKCFRRAAHKIYFIMLKRNIIKKNRRFLNVV